MFWMMGNEFYDIVTMKIKCNWKYNFDNIIYVELKWGKPSEKSAENSTCLY